ncbi:conserved hypothetical protein [Vibrio coralliirubri]|uniref:NAD(P)-dependent oxidoreductase n=1 Tax=Vibrio coralliirubri TaxID=1516159 RepID=UPI00063A5637|nr:NAD(P)-binding oxidoreductase [Vibrio coralliirubri]CDT33703.1 conserved hypothetical protein [Vibrio coralliirubri]
MTVLLLGATGATGRLVARELLVRGFHVKAIVRSLERLDSDLIGNQQMEVVVANITEVPECQLVDYISSCEAVICCLGHNLTFKGVYGQPRKLVVETTKRICQAVDTLKPLQPVKFVLMGTTGYQNLLRNESVSLLHKIVIYLVRKFVPPHVDNEKAAQYLQYEVASSSIPLEWVVVRPDSLVDLSTKSDFSVHPSPICDPIFASMKSSRINVADFMVDLVSYHGLWAKWKNEMPVIYDNQ